MVRTRVVNRPDGRQEVFRLLSTEDLANWSNDEPLAYEKSIVWLEDISGLRFVRVAEVRGARSRRGRLRLSGTQRLIGYAKLMPDAPRDPSTKGYTRRFFYLQNTDLAPGGSTPDRAVDPKTVLPGVRGAAPKQERSN
jgi:hypothetical protein